MSDLICDAFANMSLIDLGDAVNFSRTCRDGRTLYRNAIAEKGKLLHRACYDRTYLGQDPLVRNAWLRAGFPYIEGVTVSQDQGYAIVKRAVGLLKNYPLQKLCKFFGVPLSGEETAACSSSDDIIRSPRMLALLRRLKSLHHKLALDIVDRPDQFLNFFGWDRQEFVDNFFPAVCSLTTPPRGDGAVYTMEEKIAFIFQEITLMDGKVNSSFFEQPDDFYESWHKNHPGLALDYLPEFFCANPSLQVKDGLKQLDLTEITFSSTLPFSIRYFNRIKELSIGDSDAVAWNWEKLPATIGEFTDLEELAIQSCDVVEIPREIGNLRQLKRLVCCMTHLSGIPSELSQLINLEELLLWENRIETIPDECLRNLSKLKKLDLVRNRLSVVPPSMSQLINLGELFLSENRIETIPDEFFVNLRNLKKLDLSRNPLRALPESLRVCPKLVYLDITETDLVITDQLLRLILDLRARGCDVECSPRIDFAVSAFSLRGR